MGQRHQAFIIAKVKARGSTEAKYRCIAAYHHQWCYGTLPLRATRRLLTLVKQPENAEIIREELRSVDGKYARPGEDPAIPDAPCPFTALLLGNSWDIDLSEAYLSGVSLHNSLLSANMGSWDGHNDDGITVVDVTNPESPAYCHLVDPDSCQTSLEYLTGYYSLPLTDENGELVEDNSEQHEQELLRQAQGDPERAKQFREGERQFKKGILSSVSDMEGEHLLSRSALSEAWPDEYPEPPLRESTVSSLKVESTVESGPGVSSLVEASLRKTIEQCIESGDASALDGLVWLSEKMHIVEDCLLRLDPLPDTALPVLSMLLKDGLTHTASLDLTRYALTPDQVVNLTPDIVGVRSLNLSGYAITDGRLFTIATNLTGLRILNLSRNDTVTVQGVQQLLLQLPSLRRLVLMNCSSVPDPDLAALARNEPHLFRNLDAIIHPVFLQLTVAGMDPYTGIVARSLDNPPFLPLGMSVICMKSDTSFHPRIQGVSLPFVHPPLVVQGFTDFLTAAVSTDTMSLSMNVGRACEVAFAGLPREPGRSWAERSLIVPKPLDFGLIEGGATGWVLFIKLPPGWGQGSYGWAFLRCLGRDAPPMSEVEETAEEDGEDEENESDKPTPTEVKKAPAPRPKLNYELHDLRSFVKVTEQEGFRAVSEEALVALETLVGKVEWPVLPREEVDKIVK